MPYRAHCSVYLHVQSFTLYQTRIRTYHLHLGTQLNIHMESKLREIAMKLKVRTMCITVLNVGYSVIVGCVYKQIYTVTSVCRQPEISN